MGNSASLLVQPRRGVLTRSASQRASAFIHEIHNTERKRSRRNFPQRYNKKKRYANNSAKKVEKIAFLNGHYSEKRLFANSSAIAACLPANGRVDRWTSEPALTNKYTRAHAYVYVLENCWFTGSLVQSYFAKYAPKKNVRLLRFPFPLSPRVFFAGLPRVVSKPNLPKKCTIFNVSSI